MDFQNWGKLQEFKQFLGEFLDEIGGIYYKFGKNLEKIGGNLGALQYNVPLAGYEHVLCIKL